MLRTRFRKLAHIFHSREALADFQGDLPEPYLGSAANIFSEMPPNGNGKGRAAEMDHLEAMLARGDFDLVAAGRAMLADSSWAAKVRDGRFGELSGFSPEVLKTLA